MNINEKLEKIFNSDYKVIIRNVERWEWTNSYNSYNRIIWEAYLKNYPENPIGKSEWFGFDNPEDCIDDCLKFIIKKENER